MARRAAPGWLAHLLFAATAALLFAGSFERPHYQVALGANAERGEAAALVWLLWAKSLLPLLPVQALAWLAGRAGFARGGRAGLGVATAGIGAWLVLDLWVQVHYGATLASYLPFLGAALHSADHAQWAGDPLRLARDIALLLAATAVAGTVLWRLARAVAAPLPLRAARAIAVIYVALVAGAFALQPAVSSLAVRKRVALALPYPADALLAVSAAGATAEWRLLGVVPWPWSAADRVEVMIQNATGRERSADGLFLANAGGQRVALAGEVAGGETLHVELERSRFDVSRHADAVRLVDRDGTELGRIEYRDEDVKRGAAVWSPGGGDAALRRVGDAARESWSLLRERIVAARPALLTAATRPDPPDVVLLVVESFRHKIVGPELLARLDALGTHGLRARRHYAGSNSSHLGLFALLFGRLPLAYDAVLDAGATPTAIELFRRIGYRTAFVSSGEIESWKRMDQFLGPQAFDEVVLNTPSEPPLWQHWPASDRKTLAAIRAIVAAPGPQFVVGFLMTTHFPYPYPPAFERFTPASHEDALGDWSQLYRAPLDRERLWNRYRNAALSLEAELVDFAGALDTTRTVLAVTGDHGESFGEDGALVHGSRASDAQSRVPFLLVGPGVAAREIDAPTAHMDVLPTLLHAATGTADPVHGLDGRDLLGAEALPDEAVVAPYKLTQPADLLWIHDRHRVLFRVRLDGPELDAFAFVDAAGMPLLEPEPVDSERLADAIRRQLARLAGPDAVVAAPAR